MEWKYSEGWKEIYYITDILFQNILHTLLYNIRNTVFDTDIEEFPLKRKFTSLYFLHSIMSTAVNGKSIYDKGKYRN
jgi:hypothetical protein